MNRKTKISLAVAGLALAALACQAVTDTGDDEGDVDPNAPTSTPRPRVIFSDDFREQTWGTGTDSDSSVEYANEALQMIVYTPNWFVWSTPNTEEYQNIQIEVTVTNNDTDSTTAFGIMCNQQEVRDDFYYFAVTPAGEYAIAKASEGQRDVFLTNEDQWAVSELIPQEAASYNVGADCGNGTLTLYVNSQQIASVSDSSYISGTVALFVFSGEEATTTDVSFDDFLIMELP
ncbi:MAG TPA: hypothetical protein VFQ13_10250 [Anaerolineales bacterium]|nr:hypothetical protein [Anaerolineales bacterium]